jgi:hypothetical protein
MKLSRLFYRNAGLPCLLLAVLVNSAIAVPGICSKKTCTAPVCGSTTVPCRVVISRNTHGATATIQNFPSKPNAEICVKKGTEIIWSAAESTSEFTADFGITRAFSNSPQGAIFTGTNGQTARGTTVTPDCYTYSVEHCTAAGCKKKDPKVIVTNVVLHP